MDTVKSEKETAMRRYRRLRRLGRALRCLEACAAVVALSWSSARLPGAARASGEAIRAAASLLLSPGFVFLIGNAIVILLFTKFRHLAAPTSSAAADAPGADDLYTEFLEGRDRVVPYAPPALPAGEVVYEDKEVCLESRRALRRSRSAGVTGGRRRKEAPELRRTESEVVERKGEEKREAAVKDGEAAAGGEDAEEFRRTIEEFIKKHQMFQREEESMAVVSSAGPPQLEIIKYY